MASDYNRSGRALRITVGIAVLIILLLVGSVGVAAVTPQPTITSISSTSGVAGMAITINGQNFGTNPGTVLFGDITAKLGQPNDDKGQDKWGNTKIVALVPIGIGTVQVSVKDSKGAKSEGVPFTYLDVPIVSQWRWPRDKATPIEGWGYDIYSSKDGGNHTGIDIWEEKNKINTSVFAAADGIVVAKCPYGEKCIGFSTNDHNHRLYSVVIIAHRLSKETLVYSMYADMADDLSSTPKPGERVYMGKTILGQTGRYIQYLDDDGTYKQRWISHVHFEIKNEPVLHNPDWDAHLPIWGYTNQGKTRSNYKPSPDNYGYRNPELFINVPILLSPTNDAKDVTIPPTLSWSAVSEAQSYGIQVSRNKDFTDIVYDKTDLTTTSVVIPELNSNTPYWWRANAKIAGENWPWSNVHSFTKVTMDESPKESDGFWDRLKKAIEGIEEYFAPAAQKAKEVFNEYIRIPEAQSAPSTLSPTISVSPTSGQQKTTFYYTGNQYTPNGIIEWHVRKPDGVEYPPADLTGKVDGSGNFNYNYASSCGNQVGAYTLWAFDKSTGKRSDDTTQTITTSDSCVIPTNPTVSVSPTSGQQKTTFYYSGNQYTPNGIVEWHVRKPDGVEYPPADLTGKVDGSGNFNYNYASSCGNQVGAYTLWTFDKSTGKRSNDATQTITTSDSC